MTGGEAHHGDLVAHGEPDHVRVALIGELDFVASRDLNERFVEVLAAHTVGDVVLDLTGLAFVDSSGLRMLLVWQNLVGQAGRRFRVQGAQGPVARALTVSGLDDKLGGGDVS